MCCYNSNCFISSNDNNYSDANTNNNDSNIFTCTLRHSCML